MDIKILEKELLKLTPREKAVISYKLLKSLDTEENQDYEDVWIDEALNRYNQISEDKSLIHAFNLVIKESKSKYN
ncbi:MAG: addiction module protein [Ignavibacteriaceae bacterium]|nr:addiction module protein [Ignavibacterium sp.]MCC6254293.1 addiction module protein [Ignavibacteriaceae bacterium]HMN23227.1 addiction module protein [Ignavibacteriaceae bacterium]HRN27216.1 addiction module protein [Ignavibacteriaceae bacterium]HRP92857.1 addiction module protein [Ignavibacteriaceae bacterium]